MRILGKWSISSFLMVLVTAASLFLALVLALTMVLVTVSPFFPIGNAQVSVPVSFSVDPQTVPMTSPSLNVERAQIRGAHAELLFRPAGRLFLAAPAGVIVGMVVLAILVLDQLRAVFRTLRDGRPFVPANATRIRRIAYAVIGAELARAAVVWTSHRYVAARFAAAGLRFDARPELNILALVAGLIILVIAEVFRVGTRLDEEQSLTI